MFWVLQLACELSMALTCCDRYHLECLDPPLSRVPRGDWFCPDCTIALEPVQEQTGDSCLAPPLRRRPVARRRMAHALVVERVRSTIESMRVQRRRQRILDSSSSEDEEEAAVESPVTSLRQESTVISSAKMRSEAGDTGEVGPTTGPRGEVKFTASLRKEEGFSDYFGNERKLSASHEMEVEHMLPSSSRCSQDLLCRPNLSPRPTHSRAALLLSSARRQCKSMNGCKAKKKAVKRKKKRKTKRRHKGKMKAGIINQ